MVIDLNGLLAKAFFTEEVENATEALERARERYESLTQTGGTSFEIVAPAEPDDAWVRDRLLRPLVYVCESEGRPLPRCAGLFVSLFTGPRLHAIAVEDVVEWARGQLGVSIEDLRAQYGTHEQDTALR